MKQLAACALALLAAITSGCATGASSPYFQPRKGVLYEYGNFCGPSLPRFATKPGIEPESRLKTIQQTKSVDGIDRACRTHDLCYEILGHDNEECDYLVWAGLEAMTMPTRACYNLKSEVSSALFAKRLNILHNMPSDPLVSATAQLAVLPFMLIHGAGERAIGGNAGWPKPGECGPYGDFRVAIEQKRFDLNLALLRKYSGQRIPRATDYRERPHQWWYLDIAAKAVSEKISIQDLMGDTNITLAEIARRIRSIPLG